MHVTSCRNKGCNLYDGFYAILLRIGFAYIKQILFLYLSCNVLTIEKMSAVTIIFKLWDTERLNMPQGTTIFDCYIYIKCCLPYIILDIIMAWLCFYLEMKHNVREYDFQVDNVGLNIRC